MRLLLRLNKRNKLEHRLNTTREPQAGPGSSAACVQSILSGKATRKETNPLPQQTETKTETAAHQR